ncbi:DNA helicase [Paraconexibacter sp. AEG42_29]|uniref:DNA helicase n=1 Tax=Paraconexibacter sp. AEG42_29 TaxID=2997339 RepID=A0AAU7B2N8_9ACTN
MFDATPYLDRLKPFQMATVEHIFARMFDADDPVNRYLCADEVGLGKTMIARGLIAKMIEHYSVTEPTRRIDVLYVCSNQAIAKQNFSKLAIVGNSQRAVTDRITKLPLHLGDLERELPELGIAVNFIPITPTTSLDLRSNVGRVDERALLWTMLGDERLIGRRGMRRVGAERLLRQKQVGDWSWQYEKRRIGPGDIDSTILDAFVADIRSGSPSLLERFAETAELFTSKRAWDDNRNGSKRTSIVGDLRRQLAETCIRALSPDLIILDEFQRFPKLLDPDETVGALADLLFQQHEAKTLLLSATPYRMLTRSTELDENHHDDFLKTTKFLLEHDTAGVEKMAGALVAYREGLRDLGRGGSATSAVVEARDVVSHELRRVMCRTERLAATADRNGMLAANPAEAIGPRLEPADLLQFRELDRISDAIKSQDVVEYWKSCPYPLNFMDGYKFAERFEGALKSGDVKTFAHGLDVDAVRATKPIDLGNARLRGLVDQLEAERAWSLLWLPPSLPYYTPGQPFQRASVKTKRLIFSSWTVVPKAIAALTSYEAERHLFAALDSGARTEVQGLQWRPDGPMTELVMSMPSLTMAELGDPLIVSRKFGGADSPASRPAVLQSVRRAVKDALAQLEVPTTDAGRGDPRWYIMAPLLLDDQGSPGSAAALLDAAEVLEVDAAAWRSHLRELRRLLADPSDLGKHPSDLIEVLAKNAIAGPGTAALRSLSRSAGQDMVSNLGNALTLGLAFRALFNLPESYAIVRALTETASGDDVFWKAAIDYCLAGNLQAVLDEYVHALTDWVEDRPADQGGKVGAIVATAAESLGIKTTDLTVRTVEDGKLGKALTMRTRFALRLSDGRSSEDAKSVNRVDTVRKAFNSPFWPFVLATTSIGQEGLDFHHYSHAVVHWNLPSNPVDLEQREGRVHRFKSHAVRRNIAASYRAEGVAATDPWGAMFAAAPPKDDGLQPYWVFEGTQEASLRAKIERHALTMPMSRDAERLKDLVQLLGIYRLAFGQPRQDELLAALRIAPDLEAKAHELLIDLQPLAPATAVLTT